MHLFLITSLSCTISATLFIFFISFVVRNVWIIEFCYQSLFSCEFCDLFNYFVLCTCISSLNFTLTHSPFIVLRLVCSPRPHNHVQLIHLTFVCSLEEHMQRVVGIIFKEISELRSIFPVYSQQFLLLGFWSKTNTYIVNYYIVSRFSVESIFTLKISLLTAFCPLHVVLMSNLNYVLQVFDYL